MRRWADAGGHATATRSAASGNRTCQSPNRPPWRIADDIGQWAIWQHVERGAVEAHVSSAGGRLLATFKEVESGKKDDRPALAEALAHCRLTGARLVIAKLDRLSRDVHFLSGLMKAGVDFVACDMPTANRLTVHILAGVAEEERRATSERTKAALGSIKARLATGEVHVSRRSNRVISRLGNPMGLSASRPELGVAAVVARADAFAAEVGPTAQGMRAEGLSFAAIAGRLARMGVRTPRGGVWTPMGVKRVLDRAAAQNPVRGPLRGSAAD